VPENESDGPKRGGGRTKKRRQIPGMCEGAKGGDLRRFYVYFVRRFAMQFKTTSGTIAEFAGKRGKE
jgi:hypothetical protein